MKPLKLHIKTALLTSAITVGVLMVSFFIRSAKITELLQEEQKSLAELQAIALANQVGTMLDPPNTKDLVEAMTLVLESRRRVTALRIWERVDNAYAVVASAGEPVEGTIPEDTLFALRGGQASRTVTARPTGNTGSRYRVFAPVLVNGQVIGAVELVEALETESSVVAEYEKVVLGLSLATVVLIGLSVYGLFRHLIYHPMSAHLAAMERVNHGALDARIGSAGRDEFGVLAAGFNTMIGRLAALQREREEYQQGLEQRIAEATVELKEKNARLALANSELWEATRRMRELERLASAGQTAAQFAHEVGTPLNLISGHIQLLRNRLADDEKSVNRLRTIGTQIDRIERIVRNLLDRTRSEATPAPLQPVDLNMVLDGVCSIVLPTLESHHIHLDMRLAEAVPPISGNLDQLQQVFLNLINNAIDAIDGSGTISVESRAEPAETRGNVVVVMRDTGRGMTDETRQRIFDPLFTTKEVGRGTGLGLVIVKQILREHRADIQVDSSPGRGTTFRLVFPAISGETT